LAIAHKAPGIETKLKWAKSVRGLRPLPKNFVTLSWFCQDLHTLPRVFVRPEAG